MSKVIIQLISRIHQFLFSLSALCSFALTTMSFNFNMNNNNNNNDDVSKIQYNLVIYWYYVKVFVAFSRDPKYDIELI